MNVLEEFIIKLGFNTDTKGLKDAAQAGKEAASKIKNDFKSAAEAAAKSFAAISTAVAAVQAGMFKLVNETADYANEIDKVSKSLGVQADEFQRLKFIQGQTGGSTETLIDAFKTLNTALNDALVTGAGPAIEGLAQIGIKAEDLAAQDSRGKLKLLAEGFKNVDDPAMKAAIAMKFLGGNAGDLLGMFELGADGIDKMAQRADELGIVMGQDAIAAGTGFKDSLDEMQQVLGSVVRLIGTELTPIVKDSVDQFKEWMLANRGLIKERAKEFIKDLIEVLKKLTPIMMEVVELAVQIAEHLGGVGLAAIALAPQLISMAKGFGGVAIEVAGLIGKLPVLGQVAVAATAGLAVGHYLDEWLGISEYVSDTLISMQGIAQITGKEYGTRVNRELLTDFERSELEKHDRLVAAKEKASAEAGFFGRAEADANLKAARMNRQRAEKLLYDKYSKQPTSQQGAAFVGPEYIPNLGLKGLVSKPKKSKPGAGGGSQGPRVSRKVRGQFESTLRKLAEGTGLGDIAIDKGLMAIQGQLEGGALDSVALKSGIGALSGLSGQDLQAKYDQSKSSLFSLLGAGQPDLPLSEITKGAQPQVLTSIINNNFNFDNEFNIDGAGDPGAVGQSVVESFRTYFQETVEATTRSVKVNFAR